MKIEPQDLEKNGYVLFDKLKHAELKDFLNDKDRAKGILSYTFILLLFLPMGLVSYFLTFNIIRNHITVLDGILLTLLGIGFVFLFIPIHELLHALAYKAVGAKNISYYSNFKKFYFATVSHKSVINVTEFLIVAFVPFLTVVLATVILFPLVNVQVKTALLAFVSTHTLFCIGDFALSDYMQIHRSKGIVTFDDAEKQESYFYIKKT